MYLMRMKSPEQSANRWEVWKKVAVIPSAVAFPSLPASRCPLVKSRVAN